MTSCCLLSHVRLFATPWTVAHQSPLSMGFCRQEYGGGLPFPSPGDLPSPGTEPASPESTVLQADSLPGEALYNLICAVWLVLNVQLRPALCNPTDCSPPGSTVHGDSPGKNTGVGCHALLHGSSQPRDRALVSCMAGGFFTTWATRRSSRLTGVGSHSLLQGSFPTPELNRDLLHCRWILYQLSSQGSP